MKIASWNINSIRARFDTFKGWVHENPDIDMILLQELKCEENSFPKMEMEALGFHTYIKGQKSYNGVGILSKEKLHLVHDHLPGMEHDPQARFIEIKYKDMRVINIYLPNGNGEASKYDYKLEWMDKLYARANHLFNESTPFIIGGDFNVIPQTIDCYSPEDWREDALFKLETRLSYFRFLNLGLTDCFRTFDPSPNRYTFWDYQAGRWQKDEGIRIDHFLASPEIADRLKNCLIDKDARGKDKASDHTPIIVELEIE